MGENNEDFTTAIVAALDRLKPMAEELGATAFYKMVFDALDGQIAALIGECHFEAAGIMREQVERMRALAPTTHPLDFIAAWKTAAAINQIHATHHVKPTIH